MAEQIVIDADMHVRDEAALLREYLPPRWKERRFLVPNDGQDRDQGGTLGKRVVNAEIQLADMDVEGIQVAVLYPTGGLSLGELRDAEYAAAFCRAYNDWLSDYCAANPGRLKGVALVPLQDMRAAVEELERAVTRKGMVAALFPTFFRYGPTNPGDAYFDPFYAAAERLGVPVAYHASGGMARSNERFGTFLEIHIHSHVPEQMAMVTSVLLGGVLERFPELAVGFMEAGCGWVPFWLEHIDEEWEKRRDEAPLLKARPSEYALSGRCYFGVEPEERMLPVAAEMLGGERFLYASDYPHWDGDWPNTVRTLRERADLSQDLKDEVLGQNARRFYHFEF